MMAFPLVLCPYTSLVFTTSVFNRHFRKAFLLIDVILRNRHILTERILCVVGWALSIMGCLLPTCCYAHEFLPRLSAMRKISVNFLPMFKAINICRELIFSTSSWMVFHLHRTASPLQRLHLYFIGRTLLVGHWGDFNVPLLLYFFLHFFSFGLVYYLFFLLSNERTYPLTNFYNAIQK